MLYAPQQMDVPGQVISRAGTAVDDSFALKGDSGFRQPGDVGVPGCAVPDCSRPQFAGLCFGQSRPEDDVIPVRASLARKYMDVQTARMVEQFPRTLLRRIKAVVRGRNHRPGIGAGSSPSMRAGLARRNGFSLRGRRYRRSCARRCGCARALRRRRHGRSYGPGTRPHDKHDGDQTRQADRKNRPALAQNLNEGALRHFLRCGRFRLRVFVRGAAIRIPDQSIPDARGGPPGRGSAATACHDPTQRRGQPAGFRRTFARRHFGYGRSELVEVRISTGHIRPGQRIDAQLRNASGEQDVQWAHRAMLKPPDVQIIERVRGRSDDR